jgi:hypothetical protein
LGGVGDGRAAQAILELSPVHVWVWAPLKTTSDAPTHRVSAPNYEPGQEDAVRTTHYQNSPLITAACLRVDGALCHHICALQRASLAVEELTIVDSPTTTKPTPGLRKCARSCSPQDHGARRCRVHGCPDPTRGEINRAGRAAFRAHLASLALQRGSWLAILSSC